MFIERKRELQVLSDLYERNHLKMAVIYGCRLVGKSTLITEFIKDKKRCFILPQRLAGKEIWNCSAGSFPSATGSV